MFETIDSDGSGSIDLGEFLEFLDGKVRSCNFSPSCLEEKSTYKESNFLYLFAAPEPCRTTHRYVLSAWLCFVKASDK